MDEIDRHVDRAELPSHPSSPLRAFADASRNTRIERFPGNELLHDGLRIGFTECRIIEHVDGDDVRDGLIGFSLRDAQKDVFEVDLFFREHLQSKARGD